MVLRTYVVGELERHLFIPMASFFAGTPLVRAGAIECKPRSTERGLLGTLPLSVRPIQYLYASRCPVFPLDASSVPGDWLAGLCLYGSLQNSTRKVAPSALQPSWSRGGC